ncbi:hypothetical protein Goarm_009314, partial [Gossypium armourianum]|nr:hypothetical protein [Gossypium armourianum]
MANEGFKDENCTFSIEETPTVIFAEEGREGSVPHRSIFYPRNEPLEITYYEGKNCKSTGFHTRKGRYVVMQEKLPNYVVPDLTDFKEKFRARLLFSDALVNIME